MRYFINYKIVNLDFELKPEDGYRIGTAWEDSINDCWVPFTEEQESFYAEHPTATAHEIFRTELNPVYVPTEEDELEQAKSRKLRGLDEYNNSSNINVVNIYGMCTWFNFDQRSRFKTAIEAKYTIGLTDEDTISYPVNGQVFTFTLAEAKQLLARIECYACDAEIVTQMHKMRIEQLTSKEAIEAYDYTVGYPEIITLTVSTETSTEE